MKTIKGNDAGGCKLFFKCTIINICDNDGFSMWLFMEKR